MHTSGTHRSHLIPNAASSASDPLPSPADSAQLRRQAALFNAHRVGLDEAEAEAITSDASAQEPKADGDTEGSHAPQKAAQEAQQQPHAPMRWPTRGGSNGASLAAGDDEAGAGSGLVMLPLLVGEQESGQRHDPPPPPPSAQPHDDAKRDETPRARIPMPVPASLTMRIAPSTAAASTSGTQAATFATPQHTRPIAGVLARAGSPGSPIPATPVAQPDEQSADSQSNPSFDAEAFAMPHQQAAQPQPLAQAQTQSQPQTQAQPQSQTQPQRVEAASSTQTITALDNKQPSAPLIDSIVSSVADFCANPVVFSCSPWHLTVPLDPALLPGCQLSLMLSHFDLTLRFSTSDTASQQLILRHADALKERLETLPGLHRDNRRGIDITVT